MGLKFATFELVLRSGCDFPTDTMYRRLLYPWVSLSSQNTGFHYQICIRISFFYAHPPPIHFSVSSNAPFSYIEVTNWEESLFLHETTGCA